MSPPEVSAVLRSRLAQEIRDDATALSRIAAAMEALLRLAPSEAVPLALAFELERYFTCVETTMTRVLRTLDGEVPEGPNWHGEVLRLAATAVPTVRPAFVDRSALPGLRDLLSFRYFARHGYHADIDPIRVGDLARAAVTLCPDLLKSSHAFADFLAEQTPA
jgi:hypothetical protein